VDEGESFSGYGDEKAMESCSRMYFYRLRAHNTAGDSPPSLISSIPCVKAA
jgi:hypothetical protein